MRLQAQELYFKSGDARLFFRTWEAPDSRATLVLLHGMGEHSGRYAELGETLSRAGLTTAAFDLRGHGHSAGRLGHVERFEQHVDDLAVFWKVVEDLGRPGPRFVLGHSVGGLVAVHYVLRERPPDAAGLVLSSPALQVRSEAGRTMMAVAKLLDRIAPGFGLPDDIRPRHLTHDEQQAEEHARDPLVHRRTTPRTFLEMLRGMAEARDRAGEIVLPLLVLGGTDDRLFNPQAMRELVERASSPDKRLVLYPQFFHMIFHETDRERVRRDLLAWLEARIP